MNEKTHRVLKQINSTKIQKRAMITVLQVSKFNFFTLILDESESR